MIKIIIIITINYYIHTYYDTITTDYIVTLTTNSKAQQMICMNCWRSMTVHFFFLSFSLTLLHISTLFNEKNTLIMTIPLSIKKAGDFGLENFKKLEAALTLA